MTSLPTETIAVRLHQHLPKQISDWTEETLKKHLKIEKVPIAPLKQGEVLVKMERAPINPVDLLIMSKQYSAQVGAIPLPIIPGYEGNGTVVAQGGGFEGLVGKRVAVLGQGWTEYAVVSGATSIPLPDDVSWEEGSSVFINPLSVLGMIKIAQDRGLKAIVHTAAASALGKMLIKFGKSQGINVICVVRKDQQAQECREAGATYVLNTNDKDFDEQLKRIAEKENATLAYDAVAGELTGRVLAALPFGSEIKVYGGLSLEKVGGIPFGELIFENKRVSGYWLTEHTKDPNFTSYAYPLVPKLLKGELATKVANTVSLEDIHRAILYYRDHMTDGKLLVNLSSARK